MEKICKEHIDELSEELAGKLITLGSTELTLTQEVEPEWQGAASILLSTLGLRHAQTVMRELLNKFQPGGSPHFFVVKTLGQLATSNGNCLSLCLIRIVCVPTFIMLLSVATALLLMCLFAFSWRGCSDVEYCAWTDDPYARSYQTR